MTSMEKDPKTSSKNIEQVIRRLIASIVETEPDQIDPDAHLVEDLGMDSMMALEILAGLEKEFRIVIPENELPTITTLNRAVQLAQKFLDPNRQS